MKPRSAERAGAKLVDPGATADSPVIASLNDPATFAFLMMVTKPRFTAEYRAADGGKTAVHMLRWVFTRGEKVPWRGRKCDSDGIGVAPIRADIWMKPIPV